MTTKETYKAINANQFYPTPSALIDKMLSKIDFNHCDTFLEPEAGKGDIAERILQVNYASVDCIEIDPHLRQILKYNFSEARFAHEQARYSMLEQMPYSKRTAAQNAEMERLRHDLDVISHLDKVRVIYDDFLTFHTAKRYHYVVMNPPFSDGDLHLLHAIDLQRNGGGIVCLLNAETIRNPCTNTRLALSTRLEQLEAKIEFIQGAFTDAERKTDVEIALVHISIPCPRQRSNIFEHMKKAREAEKQKAEGPDEIVSTDYIHAAVARFDFEVAGTLALIQEYEAAKPYMLGNLEGEDAGTILTLSLQHEKYNYAQSVDVNDYMRIVRLKYWRALFSSPQFTGMMTGNIRKEYAATVEKLQDYDVNLFNIRTLQTEILSRITQGVQETIMELFEKLTAEHTWYPETTRNIHYFNGWKTNKAHKVGAKSIIPTYGMFSTSSWSKESFYVSRAYEILSDIEKAFNYLDDGMMADVDLRARLQSAEARGQTRNIECKYFKVDLFKKGTTHIKFTAPKLVERFNIYAAQHKAWLPPCYGKAAYDEMQPEEQAVVDSFQGQEAYKEVLRHADYYLADIRSMPLLEGMKTK